LRQSTEGKVCAPQSLETLTLANTQLISSPAAIARARVPASDASPISERLSHLYKTIIQRNDETHYLNSTVIHDSILRLNDITIEDAIRLEPQPINLLDGMGNTPLH
jgi:tRNA A37 threonylcarbamoyladenosine synthetase subunit TsaC/SUA5/YrdC